jgi:DNA-binding NarL/FixJ family response regulator
VAVGTAEEAVAWAKDPSVQLVLLDVRLGERDGLWALEQIRKVRSDLPVVMLSTFADAEFVQGAIELGANGYVLKEASTAQLAEAISIAMSGRGLYLHPGVTLALARPRGGVRESFDLSGRELAILELLAEGETNEKIAGALYLSEKTIKSHLSSIFRKLGVTNRTQAALKAIREHVVTTPS